jgi:hypothetical protein
MPSASGIRAMPQKKVNAMAAATTPRITWTRIAVRVGQPRRVASHTGAISARPTPLRSSSALYAPTASAAPFISASISENRPTAASVTAKGSAGWSRVMPLL